MLLLAAGLMLWTPDTLYVTVADSASGEAVAGAIVSVTDPGAEIVRGTTDTQGRARMPITRAGSYTVEIGRIGFREERRSVVVASARSDLRVLLARVASQLAAVQVTSRGPVSVDTKTGDQG